MKSFMSGTANEMRGASVTYGKEEKLIQDFGVQT